MFAFPSYMIALIGEIAKTGVVVWLKYLVGWEWWPLGLRSSFDKENNTDWKNCNNWGFLIPCTAGQKAPTLFQIVWTFAVSFWWSPQYYGRWNWPQKVLVQGSRQRYLLNWGARHVWVAWCRKRALARRRTTAAPSRPACRQGTSSARSRRAWSDWACAPCRPWGTSLAQTFRARPTPRGPCAWRTTGGWRGCPLGWCAHQARQSYKKVR